MAEAAVSFVVQSLASLLMQQVDLLGSAKHHVESIKNELESIRSFLEDADARAEAVEVTESNEGIKTWVKQVREEAYRIEDVIDEYILKQAQLPNGNSNGLINFLCKFCCFIKKMSLHRGVASEIEDIKSKLVEIQRRGQHYMFRSMDQGSDIVAAHHDSRVGSFFVEDAQVVGIESARDKLLDWVVNGRPERSVIAVSGEGGLGKTTLLGKVFNHQAVKKHFDCQVWITVGKTYTRNDLLKTIRRECYRQNGESPPEEADKMSEKELVSALREHLMEKRFLVVFDDVWTVDFWGDVEHALVDNNKSSRVMLTTRNKAIADFCKSSSFVQVHELETLPPAEAWKLFCRKTFGSSSEGHCPSELEKLSHEILAKCGGLPLAIVAVGGLLSTKNKTVSEWQKLLDGLGSKLGSDPHLRKCNIVLSEGYYDLPRHLKSCLLYFGLFPEGYSVNCARLVRLWLAEGFIPYSKRPTPEQVADEYLNELIDRSLVQVSRRYISGRPRSCRVHDLMHEIILRKSTELGFSRVLNGDDFSHYSKTRRIAIHQEADSDSILRITKYSKIHSFFLFNVNSLSGSFLSSFIADFRLLKVFDLEDAPVDNLPEAVGNLFHLHYMSVRNTKVKRLPKSIGKLINLETLDLKHSLVNELPRQIKNLKKLRYLVAYHLEATGSRRFYRIEAKLQEGFGSLEELQKLTFVQGNNEILTELSKLKELRKLGIKLTNGSGNHLSACLATMKNLESLTVESENKEILDIQSLDSPPLHLRNLYLLGNMGKLPHWIKKLQNLTRIGLFWSGLSGAHHDPITALQALPNLLELELEEAYNYQTLHFRKGWFSKLEKLILTELTGVNLVVIDDGAMPNLSEFRIGPCPLLKEIPSGIQYLKSLKLLLFRDMLTETLSMMKQQDTWEKVTEHILETRVTCKSATGNGKYVQYPTKFLSSLSPQDLDRFVQQVVPK